MYRILALFLFCSISNAEVRLKSNGWIDSGTNVRLITSGDSVGIGINIPTSKFHVVGNSFLNGSLGIFNTNASYELYVETTTKTDVKFYSSGLGSNAQLILTSTRLNGDTENLIFEPIATGVGEIGTVKICKKTNSEDCDARNGLLQTDGANWRINPDTLNMATITSSASLELGGGTGSKYQLRFMETSLPSLMLRGSIGLATSSEDLLFAYKDNATRKFIFDASTNTFTASNTFQSTVTIHNSDLIFTSTTFSNGIRFTDGSRQIVAFNGVSSGWQDDGTIVRLITVGDNVAIGGTAPTVKLEVTGSQVTGGSTTIKGNSLSVGTTNFVVNITSTGVGTATPQLTFDVNGSAQFGNIVTKSTFTVAGALQLATPLTVANGGTGRVTLGTGILRGDGTNNPGTITGTVNFIPKWITASTISATSSIFDDGTNVGINDTTPSARLDVLGVIRSSGRQTITDGRNALNLNFNDGTDIGEINAQNNTTPRLYFPLALDANALIINAQSKAGVVIISSRSNASSDFHIFDDTATKTYVFSTSQTTTGFGVVHTTTGRVGILTGFPRTGLEVNGASYFVSSATFDSNQLSVGGVTSGTTFYVSKSSVAVGFNPDVGTPTGRFEVRGGSTSFGDGTNMIQFNNTGDMQLSGGADFIIPLNTFAFRSLDFPLAGMQFCGAGGPCITDTAGNIDALFSSINGDSYFVNDLAVGKTATTARLEVAGQGNTSGTFGFAVTDLAGNFYIVGRDDRRWGINTTGPAAHLHVVATEANPAGDVLMISSANASTHYMVIRSSNGNVEFSGTAPTVLNCGTSPTIETPSNNKVGRITIGTSPGVGASCNITFAGSWSAVPVCHVNDDTRYHEVFSSATTSVLSIRSSGTLVANDIISWQCFGRR